MVGIKKSLRKLKKKKQRQTITVVLLVLIGVSAYFLADATGKKMAIFETVSDSWEGDLHLKGLLEDGNIYTSESQLPTEAEYTAWTDGNLAVDIDGPVRYHGAQAPFGAEINTDLPWPEEWLGLDQYPTAKPKFEWKIVDNMQHIDVNGDFLQSGTPSVQLQENGLLIEVYYYTFSLELALTATKSQEHDFYFFDIGGYAFGSRYMYDLSPMRGLYALPEIALTSNNESITDMGSDLATYGPTQFMFLNSETGAEVATSVVQDEFAQEGHGVNRDFFLAGGDSGAGLNLHSVTDENTNVFTVGFVKVGLPAYFSGTIEDAGVWHTYQTTTYNIRMAIPLRLSVIVTYDIAYDSAVDTFYYGIGGSGSGQNESQYWFSPLEAGLSDLQMQGQEAGLPFMEDLDTFLIVGMVVMVVVILLLRRF